jgi:hypothetical protein
VRRHPENDNPSDGRFGFTVEAKGRSVHIEIPGDDPDITCEGRPFRARRLYVDGSSWLYGFALSAIYSRLEE